MFIRFFDVKPPRTVISNPSDNILNQLRASINFFAVQVDAATLYKTPLLHITDCLAGKGWLSTASFATDAQKAFFEVGGKELADQFVFQVWLAHKPWNFGHAVP